MAHYLESSLHNVRACDRACVVCARAHMRANVRLGVRASTCWVCAHPRELIVNHFNPKRAN